jgi:hypothetical protein
MVQMVRTGHMAFAGSLYGTCGSVTSFYDTSHRHPKQLAYQNKQGLVKVNEMMVREGRA